MSKKKILSSPSSIKGEQKKISSNKHPFSLASVGLLSALTASSRVLGQVRATFWAAILSTTPLADVFYMAIKLPSLMRAYFAEGVMGAALVPTYTAEWVKQKKAWKEKGERQENSAEIFLQSVFSLLIPALLLVMVVVILAAPLLVKFYFVLSEGEQSTEILRISKQLIRITFPYLFCISLASFFASIMQSHKTFYVSGLIPILFNVVNIGCGALAFFGQQYFTGVGSVHLLAIGFLIAGIAQLVYAIVAFYYWQKNKQLQVLNLSKLFFHSSLYSLKKYRACFKNTSIKNFLRRISPTAFSSLVTHINILLLDPVALSLGSGSLAILFYSSRIAELPLGLLSYPLTMVALPRLANLAANKANAEIKRTLAYAFRIMLLFLMPAVVLGIYFSLEVVQLLFQYGQFSAHDVLITSTTLRFHLIALPALACYRMLNSLFFASGDTVTPLRSALISVMVSLTLAITVTRWYQHPAAIAFSSSVAAYFMVAYLFWKSNKQLSQPLFKMVCGRLVVYVLACVVSFAVAWLFSRNVLLALQVAQNIFLEKNVLSSFWALVIQKIGLMVKLGFFSVVFFLFYILVLRFFREEGFLLLVELLPNKKRH